MTKRQNDGKLPYSYLLMGILFLIIVTALIAGIWMNYESAKSHTVENAERLRAMTESHMDNSFRMIDTGLKLYDNTYNQKMQDAFEIVMAEYVLSGEDPSLMDLPALKDRIGGMDIHLINDQCVVEHSSSPREVGLDFSVIYPDFCQYLHKIWNSSGYYPDRVVMEWYTGALTKYGYMPSPDHRYIIELALRSESFAGERMDLQYSDVVREVQAFNPYLKEVLLFQKQKRLIYNTSYIPSPEESEMLDYILWENRSSQIVTDENTGKTVVWRVIDLRDPDYAADMSIFAKLTYDDAMLKRELDHIGILNGFAAFLVILSGGLIAMMVSRKLSRPIERLVEDVNIIAEGDLDHAVRPFPSLELSNLSGSIQVMVDRLKAQIRQCEASEERFMDLVRLLPQGVFETDLNGNITFANPIAFEVFGYDPEDLDKRINIFDFLTTKERTLASARFGEILAGKKSHGSEYTGIRKDGSTFPIMVYIAARKEEGTVTGTRGTIVDITHLKKVEEEIRELNAELEARVAQRTSELEFATREMEAFTYSVSHDLRSPLRAIDGFSHLLSESAGPCLDEKQQHFIDVIRHNVELMDNLIDGLLALSRMGRQELKREWISPEPMVREVISEFLNQAPGRKIDVRIGSLPECYADPSMLRQVFTNLIGNAVKFTSKTENARIEIGSLFRDEKAVYYVRDNGAGFDMKYANKLFMEFQRLHSQEEYEGSGIGLAIVERIIRRHGGEIWAESEPGQGATFYFSFGVEG
ncbi:MAG TPA: ATP-binding protein [Methanolinea sp.]|nr:ATP-binding protein [Methanolinea sp.]HQK55655.1 ATP-binding protein [Methanolinea sp.]